jgi:hypothetical protein
MYAPKGRLLLPLIGWPYAALVLVASGTAAGYGWRRLNLPFQLDYGEGAILWQVMNLFDRHRAYVAFGDGREVVWNYPPVYLAVVRLFSPLSRNLLWAGRLVSWMSALGIAALLCGIIYISLPRRFGYALRIAAAATGLLYLCADPVLYWIPLMRVDVLGLFLTYLGLFFFISSRAVNPWKVYLAFFCFFWAVWTKQNFLAAPFVSLLMTFILAPRRALRLCAVYGLAGVLVFLLAMRWTSGGFALNLITYNLHAFSLHRAIAGLSENIIEVRLFLILCGALLLAALLRISKALAKVERAKWTARLRHSRFFFFFAVLSLHFAVAFVISFGYGKNGSNVNYFLEWTAALVALSGLAVGLLFQEMQRAPRLTPAILTAVIFVFFVPFQMLARTKKAMHPLPQFEMEMDQEREAYERMIPLIKNTPGPVLSDDMVLLVFAGKDLLYEPATMLFLDQKGSWSPSDFERRIESHEFPFIITTSTQFWAPGITDAINRTYMPDLVIGKYQLYKPRQAFGTPH